MSPARGTGRARLTAAVLALCASGAIPAYEPATNYALHCMGCHTPDGGGEPGRVPSLRDTLAPLARTPEGRRYLVQVPGSAQSPLSNQELAQVLNWMVGTLGGAGPASGLAPFTAGEVGKYRSHPLSQVRAIRARLLASLPAPKP